MRATLSCLLQAVPEIVQQTMDEVAAITGRPHKLFEYTGHPEAERVIVAMGSGCPVIEEAVDYLTARGEKVGLFVNLSTVIPFLVCCPIFVISVTGWHELTKLQSYRCNMGLCTAALAGQNGRLRAILGKPDAQLTA